jgi:glyoxylase-like metal-dependent hydrolase (beta-lactamase superfamily II)
VRPREIASGVYYLRVGIANVYFVGASRGPWALVDAGLPGHAREIREAAESLYGADTRPSSILLTHGHLDHVGSAAELADLWDTPIFAHPLEIPFVTGRSQFPPRDPTIGGFLALIGRFFQADTIDLGDRVRPLEPAHEPLGMTGWEWHHTPGHTPGHVAFFRPQDRTVLAGDAITTVNLDSFFATVVNAQRVRRPPSPSTTDWLAAAESVKLIAGLRPFTIACGHGTPTSGGKAVMQLAELATDFPFPTKGRYVREPARADETGVVHLPPKPPDPFPGVAIGLGIAAAAGTMFAMAAHRRRRRRTGDEKSVKADTPAPAS